ncbi:MAG TPA: VOC family protein [Candidatus Paceibacterota bacterium]|nr:VOC family protein [Candidatus Paceibacterota bacterium]
MTSIEEFYSGAVPYVELLSSFVSKHNLVGRAAPDHMCYKCGSRAKFEEMREMFEQNSKYVYQTIISGRRIAYIKLQTPIESVLGPIWFVELSDQKTDGSQKDAYDHIEVFATAMTYDEMVNEFKHAGQNVIHVERPHHTTDDVDIGGFLFRCTQGPLIEKIKSKEM